MSRQYAALYPDWRDRIYCRACDRDSPGHPVPQESGGKGNPQRRGRGQAHYQRGHQERREQKTGSPGRSQGKILAEKTNYEREAKERRSELQEQERRLQQKEETLERKLENVERKEESYAARLANLEEARTKVAKPRPSRWRLWNGSPATPPRRPKPT